MIAMNRKRKWNLTLVIVWSSSWSRLMSDLRASICNSLLVFRLVLSALGRNEIEDRWREGECQTWSLECVFRSRVVIVSRYFVFHRAFLSTRIRSNEWFSNGPFTDSHSPSVWKVCRLFPSMTVRVDGVVLAEDVSLLVRSPDEYFELVEWRFKSSLIDQLWRETYYRRISFLRDWILLPPRERDQLHFWEARKYSSPRLLSRNELTGYHHIPLPRRLSERIRYLSCRSRSIRRFSRTILRRKKASQSMILSFSLTLFLTSEFLLQDIILRFQTSVLFVQLIDGIDSVVSGVDICLSTFFVKFQFIFQLLDLVCILKRRG